MESPGGVDRALDPSIAPKLTFALLHAGIFAVCIWLVFGLELPDTNRALLLLACAALYFLRHMVTLFVLLKRRLAYSEGLGLSVFIAVFAIGFLLLGGSYLSQVVVPLGWLDYGAIVLVLFGSYLNSGSELQRWTWKKDPATKGHCYTEGMFGYSLHINYFGDTLLFTGWAILAHSLIALVIPLGITLGFIFFHIPALDLYLAERYGDEFKAYAARTAKFVPFLY